MRLQTRAHVAEEARAMRVLRAELKTSIANEAALAAELLEARQRADRAEAEAAIAREALTVGYRELISENVQLRTAARSLRRQLDDAMGYDAMKLSVIDAGGEKALAAAQLAAHSAAAKATSSST